MIDVSKKFNTLRYAHARGRIYAGPETLELVRNRQVPKGDVFQVARSAGIVAAKKTAEWIVFCHPMPLDWIEVEVSVADDHIQVETQVRAIWKTGVEMEALTGTMAALLNIYDMLKPLDQTLRIGEIELVKKKGGKSDYVDVFSRPLRAAVLVLSDSTFAGTRKDKSGKIIREFLQQQPVDVQVYEVLPDDQQRISQRLMELVDREEMDLIFTTGGTGLGPKDVTPEATLAVIERQVPGIEEAIRRHGKERTPYAMLSREVCGVRKQTLIVNLPGSSRGAQESLEALFPGLLHAFPMLWGGGHNEDGWQKKKAD